MFFPIFLILFVCIPFFYTSVSQVEKKIHLYLTFLLISILLIISANGPDFTTYLKNYYAYNNDFEIKISDPFFSTQSYLFKKYHLTFFSYQAFIKMIFLLGFFKLIFKYYKKNFETSLIIIFSAIHLLPVIATTNLFQLASLGVLFFILSFNKINLLRDVPLIILGISFHQSGLAILILYSIYYFLQFRRYKIVKNISWIILFLGLIFIIIYILNYNLIFDTIINRSNIVNIEKMSVFNNAWFILYLFCISIFFFFRKDFKSNYNFQEYNLLISYVVYSIFVLLVYSLSELYAFRFLTYVYPFYFMIILVLFKTRFFIEEKVKKLFTTAYVLTALLFVCFWFNLANNKGAYTVYKIFAPIEIYCNENSTTCTSQEEYRVLFTKLDKALQDPED